MVCVFIKREVPHRRLRQHQCHSELFCTFYTQTYTYTHKHTHIDRQISLLVLTHTHIHTHTHTHTHTNTHTHRERQTNLASLVTQLHITPRSPFNVSSGRDTS